MEQESINFGVVANVDPHDGFTFGDGTLFVAIPVSMYVPEGEHRHKVAAVWIGCIFLFMWGGPLSIRKENKHVFGHLCGIFESKVTNFGGK